MRVCPNGSCIGRVNQQVASTICHGRTGGGRSVTSWTSSCSPRTAHALVLENALDSVKEKPETDAPLGSYLTADNLGPCLSLCVV